MPWCIKCLESSVIEKHLNRMVRSGMLQLEELIAWCATNGEQTLSTNTGEVVVNASSDPVYKL